MSDVENKNKKTEKDHINDLSSSVASRLEKWTEKRDRKQSRINELRSKIRKLSSSVERLSKNIKALRDVQNSLGELDDKDLSSDDK